LGTHLGDTKLGNPLGRNTAWGPNLGIHNGWPHSGDPPRGAPNAGSPWGTPIGERPGGTNLRGTTLKETTLGELTPGDPPRGTIFEGHRLEDIYWGTNLGDPVGEPPWGKPLGVNTSAETLESLLLTNRREPRRGTHCGDSAGVNQLGAPPWGSPLGTHLGGHPLGTTLVGQKLAEEPWDTLFRPHVRGRHRLP
jgi:hypothetical protein